MAGLTASPGVVERVGPEVLQALLDVVACAVRSDVNVARARERHERHESRRLRGRPSPPRPASARARTPLRPPQRRLPGAMPTSLCPPRGRRRRHRRPYALSGSRSGSREGASARVRSRRRSATARSRATGGPGSARGRARSMDADDPAARPLRQTRVGARADRPRPVDRIAGAACGSSRGRRSARPASACPARRRRRGALQIAAAVASQASRAGAAGRSRARCATRSPRAERGAQDPARRAVRDASGAAPGPRAGRRRRLQLAQHEVQLGRSRPR